MLGSESAVVVGCFTAGVVWSTRCTTAGFVDPGPPDGEVGAAESATCSSGSRTALGCGADRAGSALRCTDGRVLRVGARGAGASNLGAPMGRADTGGRSVVGEAGPFPAPVLADRGASSEGHETGSGRRWSSADAVGVDDSVRCTGTAGGRVGAVAAGPTSSGTTARGRRSAGEGASVSEGSSSAQGTVGTLGSSGRSSSAAGTGSELRSAR